MYWSWELLGYVEVARLIEGETLVQRPMYIITPMMGWTFW